ncbi:putative membrane protein [Leptospira wolbachii serovar Codice str. CDC]|uniref:Membrane protein n=1 Tax=Leptospira wolbachii serovar Codice str. CDC TaxID=1218599 RepID=R9A8P5_9LEPT|nr:hypothetical protein [Leptospira wolbachii]EOQ98526.1 putative membrane protein [Leptospira wolbachii serovar Codice str. CDC]
MSIGNKSIKIILGVLYPLLLFVSTHFGDRSDVSIILVVAAILPLYFYFLSDFCSLFGKHFYPFFLYSIILRFAVIGSPAVWSDDIYRYLFDARIFLEGISPYQYTPQDLVGLNGYHLGLEPLLSKMNSPNYYSVYPLLLQCFFSLGTLFGLALGSSFLGVQVLLLVADSLNLYLIRKLFPQATMKSYWLYFGNPIVIFEGVSQMHPEVLLITGFLLLFGARSTSSRILSFFLLTQLKFNTFLFAFGFLWDRTLWVRLFAITGLSLILWKVTVFSDLVSQGSAGIGLFFHSFRFAGILEPFFYLLLYPFQGEYLSGIISFIVLCSIYIFCFKKNLLFGLNLQNRFLFIYSLFLLFSPVIHPWYWIPWILFLVGKEKMEILVTLVSFLAFLSYGLYVYTDFVYIHWMVSISVLGYYGKKQINYFCKTT